MAVQDKFQKLRKPDDKEKFMKKAAASYKEMLAALKESLEEERLNELSNSLAYARKKGWTNRKDPPKDADNFRNEENKYEKYFKENIE